MKLTEMQEFFLKTINESAYEELNPSYISVLWCNYTGKRIGGASRDRFGHNSAASKTCKKLFQLGLINQTQHQFYATYSKKTI